MGVISGQAKDYGLDLKVDQINEGLFRYPNIEIPVDTNEYPPQNARYNLLVLMGQEL